MTDDRLALKSAEMRLDYAMQRIRMLEDALIDQLTRWHRIPGGPDLGANPNDPSPGDAVAWEAGLAIREIEAVLNQEQTGDGVTAENVRAHQERYGEDKQECQQ